jgi:hypothetical protein
MEHRFVTGALVQRDAQITKRADNCKGVRVSSKHIPLPVGVLDHNLGLLAIHRQVLPLTKTLENPKNPAKSRC